MYLHHLPLTSHWGRRTWWKWALKDIRVIPTMYSLPEGTTANTSLSFKWLKQLDALQTWLYFLNSFRAWTVEQWRLGQSRCAHERDRTNCVASVRETHARLHSSVFYAHFMLADNNRNLWIWNGVYMRLFDAYLIILVNFRQFCHHARTRTHTRHNIAFSSYVFVINVTVVLFIN